MQEVKQQTENSWSYHPLDTAKEEAGLEEVETYIAFVQNAVAWFIVNRTIMYLCLVVERRPWVWVYQRWFTQRIMYLEGMWA